MTIVIYISITIVFVISAVGFTLKHYSTVKLIVSDFLSWFGWLGKWIRKERVSSEVEGTLNGVINDFNKNFSLPLLPNCKIQWVTSENQQSVLKENQAIVCLSFDKKDHDLNFYNATYNFIQTALVAKAKPFIRRTTVKAIDLLTTKIILRQYRREILRTFNSKFRDLEQDVKNIFHRLEETDQNGLFSTLLLPEIYHLGETLYDKTPDNIIESEIELFLNWFYNLATRELDEKSILKQESPNIKVGVILIANLNTYRQYGTQAYVRRAEKYATENFGAVYLLSKGTHRNSIAKEISDILINKKGFVKINKNEISKRIGEDGKQILITCISLRPDPATIRFNAWEYVNLKFSNNERVIGIVETVVQDCIIVNISGLQVRIPNKELSAATITDATKIFFENQELQLDILECNSNSEILVLSNNGTETDPKIIIDANLSNEKPVKATVTRIQTDKEGNVSGIKVRVINPSISVFIPASKATHSRFADLSKKYSENQKVEIILEAFHFDFGDYIGRIYNLKDPYQSSVYTNLHVGSEVRFEIKDIQERFVIGEIEEGLECKLYANEVSWNENECNTNGFKIDETIKAKVILIDKEFHRISVSIKQFVPSPTRVFFDNNQDRIIHGTISRIDDNKGIYFTNPYLDEDGFVHWSELSWAYINPISASFFVGQNISVKVLQFKEEYNSIQYSCKKCYPHQFDRFSLAFDNQDYVSGEILAHYADRAVVLLNYKSIIVQAYIHKSKVSTCVFINNEDIPIYLPIGSTFNFVVEKIDKKNHIIELSRRTYFEELDDVKIGVSYPVYFTKSYSGKYFFYSQDLEGFVYNGNKHFIVGKHIEVIPVSSSTNEFVLCT